VIERWQLVATVSVQGGGLCTCNVFLDKNFRALEAFIRSKYEQKKYIAREWVPPKPTIPKEVRIPLAFYVYMYYVTLS
jgi:hypothetical protein